MTVFFFSSRRRHTRCALVTGVQTCALPIYFRLTEMQAAIGLQQLGKLPQWLAARRRNAAILESALADLHNVRLAVPPEGVDHSYYKYYAFIETAGLAPGWTQIGRAHV